MKTKIFLLTWVLMLPMACSKDETPNENLPPREFNVTTTLNGNSVALNWTAAVDPEGGIVTYAVTMDGQSLTTTETSTSYSISDLNYAKNYSGEVVAVDPEGLSTKANYSFTVGERPNTAPIAAVLTAPTTNEQGVSVRVTLVWQAATDPDNDVLVYDVYLDQSPEPATIIAENISETSYELDDRLTGNSPFYWKVVAKDTFGATTESTIGSFTTGDLLAAEIASEEPGFADRSGHTSVIFNDKMWVIGGASCCGGRYNDVWSSMDGITWSEVTANAAFEGRVAHASVVFDGKIWVTGGNSSFSAGREFSDVWFSEDGANWKLANGNAAFGPRYGHRMVVYDGQMWIIGGRDQNSTYGRNQVWTSTDGVDWKLINEDTGFNTNIAEFIVFQDKVWRFGGYTNTNVYSSTDGINWDLEAEKMPFGERHNHKLTIWDDKVWLVSGSDRATNELVELPDVWYSDNGKDWYLAAADAGYTAVAQHTVLTYNDKIWIIGGGGGWQSFFVTNDVWVLAY